MGQSEDNELCRLAKPSLFFKLPWPLAGALLALFGAIIMLWSISYVLFPKIIARAGIRGKALTIAVLVRLRVIGVQRPSKLGALLRRVVRRRVS